MPVTYLTFDQLSTRELDCARAKFVDARPADGYLYECDGRGYVFCRRRDTSDSARDVFPEQLITAALVADDQRIEFLPRYFGPTCMLTGEGLVYRWMDQLAEAYSGGYWSYYELSNGGFYMAPADADRWQIDQPGNGFAGEVTGDAAGVIVTLYALGELACTGGAAGAWFAVLYHRLRDYVDGHPESSAIYRAID